MLLKRQSKRPEFGGVKSVLHALREPSAGFMHLNSYLACISAEIRNRQKKNCAAQDKLSCTLIPQEGDILHENLTFRISAAHTSIVKLRHGHIWPTIWIQPIEVCQIAAIRSAANVLRQHTSVRTKACHFTN